MPYVTKLYSLYRMIVYQPSLICASHKTASKQPIASGR